MTEDANEPDVSLAISQLEISAGICENNAPGHEARGNVAQAVFSRASAASYRRAIEILMKWTNE